MAIRVKASVARYTISKFTARSTALEVVEGINLNGYEVIVTGGSSGKKQLRLKLN
jgi:hypothetical protein